MDLDIEDLTDERMAVIPLPENVQRKQLTGIEVVRAHRRAIDETKLTIQALADQSRNNSGKHVSGPYRPWPTRSA